MPARVASAGGFQLSVIASGPVAPAMMSAGGVSPGAGCVGDAVCAGCVGDVDCAGCVATRAGGAACCAPTADASADAVAGAPDAAPDMSGEADRIAYVAPLSPRQIHTSRLPGAASCPGSSE